MLLQQESAVVLKVIFSIAIQVTKKNENSKQVRTINIICRQKLCDICHSIGIVSEHARFRLLNAVFNPLNPKGRKTGLK